VGRLLVMLLFIVMAMENLGGVLYRQKRYDETLALLAEVLAVRRAKGKLRGKRPKLSDKQHKELWRMYETGEYSISDLAELFSVSRPTVYRTLARKAQRS